MITQAKTAGLMHLCHNRLTRLYEECHSDFEAIMTKITEKSTMITVEAVLARLPTR
jgi:hypothetical protein